MYTRANKAIFKTPSATRLSTCASVLRTAVDVFLCNLRTKSVRAIIDHIIETLPTPGEGLWEPLSVDYMKCLAALLHYPPHVEHLGVTEWESLMSFCLQNIGHAEDGNSQLSARNAHHSFSDDVDIGSGRSTPSKRTPTSATRGRHMGDKNVIEEVVICIQLLTASPNAPVQAIAERILHGLAGYVKSSIPGSPYQAAFNSINTVVTRVLFDQSELVRVSLLDLIPVIRRLWATKLSGLKDEMLVTVMLCMNVLADTARREPSESLSRLNDGLVDALYSEYIRRPEKEILQLDEVIFRRSTHQFTKTSLFGPRLGNTRSEHNWTVVWAIATLIRLSEGIAARLSVSQSLEEDSSKKQRFTSKVEDVFRDSFSSSGAKRACSLQLVPFLVQGQIELEAKASLLERLIPNILDDNSTMSSWTMVAIARFVSIFSIAFSLINGFNSIVSGPDAKLPSLKPHWQQIWNLTFRASTSQFTSRAACHLMDVILKFGLLEYSAVAETTRSMLLSVNLNGPSAISDSSLALWATIIRMSTQMNPSPVLNASKQVCGWLREVWTIGLLFRPLTNLLRQSLLLIGE